MTTTQHDQTKNESTLSIVPNQGITATTSSNTVQQNDETSTNACQPQQSLDFIGTAHAVKSLFSVPHHASDQPLCLAVHNIDGTLIIDNTNLELDSQEPQEKDEASRRIPGQEASYINGEASCKSSSSLVLSPKIERSLQSKKNPQAEALQHLAGILKQAKQHEGSDSSSSVLDNYSKPVREYIQWKFKDMDFLVGSDNIVVKPEGKQKPVSIRIEEVNKLRALLKESKDESQRQKIVEELTRKEREERSYAQALVQQQQKENVEKGNGRNGPHQFSSDMLDQVALQTCIVPSQGPYGSVLNGSSSPMNSVSPESSSSQPPTGSSPVSVVLDTYLDNIMANIPQLALCLEEKGILRSVKLLQTEDIPSMMLHSKTLDTSTPIDTVISSESEDDLFSPEIMEMNASALLRFLKANCTSNNSTYLLRRDPGNGPNNIQLYDISSISSQRQKKWIWWLATMSYRFALRLRHLEWTIQDMPPMRRRAFRTRQRSLCQTTLDLLQDLFDMEGSAHEPMVASVREHMADSFLGETKEESSSSDSSRRTSPIRQRPSSPTLAPQSPVPVLPQSPTLSPTFGPSKPKNSTVPQGQSSPHQPYANVSVDSLNKAQDHLGRGIKVLGPVLAKYMEPPEDNSNASKEKPIRRRKRSGPGNNLNSENTEKTGDPPPAIAVQLFGLHYKAVNVSLRLADYHLQNYFSSSAMQELRNAARRMAKLAFLQKYITSPDVWIQRLQLQYIWLWEHCGHFARSFASDGLWRDRGHACGDDVISLLRDVDDAFSFQAYCKHFEMTLNDPFPQLTKGMVSLQSLSAIVRPFRLEQYNGEKYIEAAIAVLSKQGQLLRDKRQVLVASCISYSRAILALQNILEGVDSPETTSRQESTKIKPFVLDLLQKRLGDACNETGKALLDALRKLLTGSSDSNTESTNLAARVLLDSAEFWFDYGLEAFSQCKDLRNLALLRCNLCQCYKLRTNTGFVEKANAASHVESCLEKACHHLEAAHEAMGQRDVDPMTWDMVSEELAATFLVLAVRRRQSLLGGGNTPILFQSLRLNPGKERSILEPMEKALKIYEQSGNAHQAAAVHYQLALTNSKVWTCQRDESKTREKLSAAFQHYNMAFHYFSTSLRGNEPTFVLLCLDLASLYAAVSGEECLMKALSTCLDTYEVFSQESVEPVLKTNKQAKDWLENMKTLADSVEERVFKLLRNLNKLEGQKYKDGYRAGLTAKMTASQEQEEGDPRAASLFTLHRVLIAIRATFND
ncbi:unnamed protein product [Cylindrotheca closterium]|uniref:Uncharacterized protein n=1 Tax=Cylindrotheca closterium TaxID=2856 RepID=A0AAD2FG18_9STRA|nr:unnamed protein product [Cylindrotheca closterium]